MAPETRGRASSPKDETEQPRAGRGRPVPSLLPFVRSGHVVRVVAGYRSHRRSSHPAIRAHCETEPRRRQDARTAVAAGLAGRCALVGAVASRLHGSLWSGDRFAAGSATRAPRRFVARPPAASAGGRAEVVGRRDLAAVLHAVAVADVRCGGVGALFPIRTSQTGNRLIRRPAGKLFGVLPSLASRCQAIGTARPPTRMPVAGPGGISTFRRLGRPRSSP